MVGMMVERDHGIGGRDTAYSVGNGGEGPWMGVRGTADGGVRGGADRLSVEGVVGEMDREWQRRGTWVRGAALADGGRAVGLHGRYKRCLGNGVG